MVFNVNEKLDNQNHSTKSSFILKSTKINELPESISRKISTSQVIITLTGACRELIDNALDAGATNIEIRTKENGTELLEVIDNGSGISVDNFERLCRPHCTSKLANLDDFNSLTSYGFRGEALNALAALSDVQILTKDAESRCAWRLSFGQNGEILKKEQCTRQQGTTISICHLFKSLPVRRQEFLRSARREFLKLIECVQAFALSHPNCRFICQNFVNGKRSQHLLSPGGTATLSEVIGSLFGVGIGNKNGLLRLEEEVEPSEEIENFYGIGRKNGMEEIYKETRLSGFISNCEPGQGRSNSDRQFIFVNRRHIDYAKICRIANDVYGNYNRGQFPILVLFMDLPPSIIDVNISPDKRIVLFHHEKELFAKFRATLLATFAKVQGACPAAIPKNINQQKTIPQVIQIEEKLNRKDQSGRNESPEPEEMEDDEFPEYSIFVHEVGKSATNSTFIAKEGEIEGDGQNEEEEKLFENDEIIEGECAEANKIVSPKAASFFSANESALLPHEHSFNPNDSQNLRDSFVLAESTPNPNIRQKSSTFEGITPIRSTGPIGFRSAAALFAIKNEEESDQQNGFGGFQSAAKLFQKSGKSFEIVSEKLNQKENCLQFAHFSNSTIPNSSQILPQIDEIEDLEEEEEEGEIQLKTPIKRAKLSDGKEIQIVHQTPKPKSNASICCEFPSTSTLGGHSPSASLLSPNSSIFEDDIPPPSTSTQIPCSSSNSFIGRPHQQIAVNLEKLKRRFSMFRKKNGNNEEKRKARIEEANLNLDERNAEIAKSEIERKLSLMLKKTDFGRMQFIGQFNNAFLIARLGPELFMIDQHAADEKFNFECLQAKTVIKSQKLIEAQNLHLGAVNAALLRDNLELFRKNGFDFEFGENEEEEEDGACGGGIVRLISTPNINGYHFDKHDIDQLISLISEMPGQLHRPTKIRAIFASKACRKSVMFGNALANTKMEEIIKNMGQMKAPWNCPHGRPTIRHLCTIHTKK